MIVRLLLVTLLALTVAVGAGHFLAADPGFIVIGYAGRVVRMSFALFLLLTALAVVLLYLGLGLAAHLLELRQRWRRWSHEYRQRRAYRSLAQGLMARAAGDFARAERLFSLGANEDAQSEAHYLAAAEAAHAGHARGRRDNYLRLADEVQTNSAATLDLQRAAWLLDGGDVAGAAAVVDRLVRNQPSGPALLRLQLRLAQQRQEPAAVLRLLPALRRDRAITHDEANVLERDCAVAALAAAAAAPDELRAVWDSLSKPLQAMSAVVAVYVHGLIRAGRHDQAEQLLARQLDRRWDSALAALYGEVQCEPASRQLRRAEAWAGARDGDRGLRLTRARLAIRAQLWGPARTQLEQLLTAAPSPLFYRLLAEIADHTGEAEAARRYRQLGLELATAG